MQPQREHRIEEILNSLEGIQPAQPSRDLWPGLEKAIQTSGQLYISKQKAYLTLAAACAMLAISAFVAFGNAGNLKKNTPSQHMYELVKSYGLDPLDQGYNYP